jgi:hypothetical protein
MRAGVDRAVKLGFRPRRKVDNLPKGSTQYGKLLSLVTGGSIVLNKRVARRSNAQRAYKPIESGWGPFTPISSEPGRSKQIPQGY